MRDVVHVDEVGPVLYKSWYGFDVHRFSYSLASDIAFCGAKTKYSRFQGLTPTIEPAAKKFGICCEESIADHYRFGLELEAGFAIRWNDYKEKTLKYGRYDNGWAGLNSTGIKLMRQFEFEKDDLPIHNPEFSVVLPRDPKATWYNGTRLEYVADCISHLPTGDILIDIKTSARAYPEHDQWPALDPQLLVGSLVSGIRRVCFITLVKTKDVRIQVLVGNVRPESLIDIDEWLKEQYDKLINRRLHRRLGFRYPEDHCTHCDFLPLCLGNKALADQNLRQKEARETEAQLDELDELDEL